MELIRVYHTKEDKFEVYESYSSSGIAYVKYMVVGKGKMAATKTKVIVPLEELDDRIVRPLISFIESQIKEEEHDTR